MIHNFIYFQERQIQKGFQISKADAQGATDIFTMTALKLKKQLSQVSNASLGTKKSGSSIRLKLTGKQKFKGLALKAIKQEHGEELEIRSPAKVNDPIGSTATSIRRRNRHESSSLNFQVQNFKCMMKKVSIYNFVILSNNCDVPSKENS